MLPKSDLSKTKNRHSSIFILESVTKEKRTYFVLKLITYHTCNHIDARGTTKPQSQVTTYQKLTGKISLIIQILSH